MTELLDGRPASGCSIGGVKVNVGFLWCPTGPSTGRRAAQSGAQYCQPVSRLLQMERRAPDEGFRFCKSNGGMPVPVSATETPPVSRCTAWNRDGAPAGVARSAFGDEIADHPVPFRSRFGGDRRQPAAIEHEIDSLRRLHGHGPTQRPRGPAGTGAPLNCVTAPDSILDRSNNRRIRCLRRAVSSRHFHAVPSLPKRGCSHTLQGGKLTPICTLVEGRPHSCRRGWDELGLAG